MPGPNERPVLDDGEPPHAAGWTGWSSLSEDDQAPEPPAARDPGGPDPYESSLRRPSRWSGAGGTSRREPQSRMASGVLADRMAAALVHHEPGWRLPRHSALARRYNVSTAEVDAAMTELAARRLIRQLPDGQAYRASPAEFLIPLEGVPALAAHLDPMGGDIACRSRQVSVRRVPEDIGWALKISPADPVCVIRFLWTADGEPAAFATTYLATDAAGPYLEQGTSGSFSPLPVTAAAGADADPEPADQPPREARAMYVEMQPPPPSVARSLRLAPGQMAATVTVRFDDPATHEPVALTVAVCRPDLFRIVVSSQERPLPDWEEGGLTRGWTHAAEGWEP